MKDSSHLRFFLIITLLLMCLAQIHATVPPQRWSSDSLMRTLWKYSERYENMVPHYESRIYMKRHVWKHKKNVLMELVPQMMSFEKGTSEYVSESLSELNYTAPDIYDRHVLAAYGTIPSLKGASDMIMDYFTLNIYSEKMISDHLLSPFIYENAKYYYYVVKEVLGNEATITFLPQYSNTQLVKGQFTLDMKNHIVKNTQFEGRYEFMKFEVNMEMGKEGLAMYLPIQSELKFNFNFAGNKLEGNYFCSYKYTKLDREYKRPYEKRHSHDLTDQYTLSLDTTQLRIDSLLVAQNRFFPLTEKEQQIYREYAQRRDSIERQRTNLSNEKGSSGINWGEIGKSMVASNEINAPLFGKIKTSPLLAPMLFNYSKTRGFDWRQELNYQRDGKHTSLQVSPLLGYNITYKEIDWRMKVGFDYWKKMQAHLDLEIGNGYRTFSSDLADIIKEAKAKDVEKLMLNYFNDTHAKINHRIEPLNGFEITLGVAWYKRNLKKKYGTPEEYEEILGNMKDTYTTFAPRVRVDWTPGKYYYWNRNKKVTVYTPAPTFSVDWEKGVSGIFGSEGSYQRYEIEISHEKEYRVQDRFSYRLGYGKFTDQKDVYFVDFNNFSHNRLPDGWVEDIGGTFHLLDYRWYSSASEYLRGHLTYESPSLFLSRLFKGASHAIQSERFYLSGLIMKHLNPYVEIGYGFATHIFDIGLFGSIMNGTGYNCGVKFSFELFKK